MLIRWLPVVLSRRFTAISVPFLMTTSMLWAADPVPEIRRLSATDLTGSVFEHPDTERLPEISEVGETQALDRVWHESQDGCLQTGVYQTGPNRYTITEPYPYDELMMFIDGGVRLTPTGGTAVDVVAGDSVLLPKGWTGVWESEGYRKMYVIYDCSKLHDKTE